MVSTLVAPLLATFLACQEFQISRDHLPFHVCRVYFTGNNTGEAPWSLTQQVPPALLDLVLEHRWQQLAQEVNKVTEDRLSPKCVPTVGGYEVIFNLLKSFDQFFWVFEMFSLTCF